MNNETCPHCGADADYKYKCGTDKYDPILRGVYCYIREIAQKAAEIERLKKDVTYWKKMATAEDSSSEGENEPYILRPLKLKEVK